jgi:hypothetical protein
MRNSFILITILLFLSVPFHFLSLFPLLQTMKQRPLIWVFLWVIVVAPAFLQSYYPSVFTDPNLRKEAKSLFEKASKILNMKDISPENQLRGAYILEEEKANIKVSFTLTPENPPLIQEYHFGEVKK